jgi:processive 1,2-diacylglycerol beta-glucosyltransferase
MPDSPASQPILIFSAGFGDGHNAAAANLRAAIVEETYGEIQPPIIDLFQEGMPILTSFLKWGYVFLTTHYPKAWKALYDHADETEPSRLGWDTFGGLPRRMSSHLARHRPAAVISTYPLYPHLLRDVLPGLPVPKFVGTVVTDSLEINSVWTKGPCDCFFVTDDGTRDLFLQAGVAPSGVVTTGFAVPLLFQQLTPRQPVPGQFKVLFFATASAKNVQQTIESLLTSGPEISQLTVVMGRHEKRLRKTIEQTLSRFPRQDTLLLGWTREVPQMLVNHDLVISKAGGATVHECFAAGIPVLANNAIPGQEEGNARLLEQRRCGWYHTDAPSLGGFLREQVATDQYEQIRQNMRQARNPNGATSIAQRVLLEIGYPTPKSSE